MNEEDENFKNYKNQKKQLLAFSQKIEELISEYKNRKKFGIQKIKEDNLQKVDLKQYNEFVGNMEELKKQSEACKIKLNNDEKYTEIIQKEDELKYLKTQFKEKKSEYQYLIDVNKRLNGFKNDLLNEEIDYYKGEVTKLKTDISQQNKEFIKTKDKIKDAEKEIYTLEKEYDLIQRNIEFKRSLKSLINLNITEKEVEQMKLELLSAENLMENVRKEYNKRLKEKNKLEIEIADLEVKLSKFRYNAYINDLKMKEIQKIENEVKLNKIKEKLNMDNPKKSEENEKKVKSKKIKNLMAESFKNHFPFSKNYKILLEEEKKPKLNLKDKPKLNIAKNKMKNSYSSLDIFNSRREEMKKKKEKEKQEFMNFLDIKLKEFNEEKGETINEIKSLKDEIERSLESNKVYDNYIDNINNKVK